MKPFVLIIGKQQIHGYGVYQNEHTVRFILLRQRHLLSGHRSRVIAFRKALEHSWRMSWENTGRGRPMAGGGSMIFPAKVVPQVERGSEEGWKSRIPLCIRPSNGHARRNVQVSGNMKM